MAYVILQILTCLFVAVVIGFFIGWYWQWLGWEKKEANLEGLFSSRLEKCNSQCIDLKMRAEKLARELAKEKEAHRRLRQQNRAPVKEAATQKDPDAAAKTETASTRAGSLGSGFFESPPDRIDNLKRISGVGPVLEKMLHRLGIYQFDQIANFSEAEVTRVASELGAFRGRITRDNWVDQAKRLLAEHKDKA